MAEYHQGGTHTELFQFTGTRKTGELIMWNSFLGSSSNVLCAECVLLGNELVHLLS